MKLTYVYVQQVWETRRRKGATRWPTNNKTTGLSQERANRLHRQTPKCLSSFIHKLELITDVPSKMKKKLLLKVLPLAIRRAAPTTMKNRIGILCFSSISSVSYLFVFSHFCSSKKETRCSQGVGERWYTGKRTYPTSDV